MDTKPTTLLLPPLECVNHCRTCQNVCIRTLEHCLAKGGEHAAKPHITLLLDCIEICQTSANFMLRDSDFHGITCRACAEICEACAGECEAMETDAPMQACAAACRECADTCRQMVATMEEAKGE